MSLVDHHVAFLAALREAGLLVSISEGLDAAAAVRAVTLADREQLRAAYAATLVKRQMHRGTFDTVFDLYFPAVMGAGDQVRRTGGMAAPEPMRPAPAPWEVDDPVRLRLREELAQYLLSGDEQLAIGIVRDAVSALGSQVGSRAGQPSWSRTSVMSRLAPQTLMAGLLAQLLRDGDQGGLGERVARSMIADRLRRFEQLVDTDVRRRLAEQRGPDSVARSASRPSIDKIAFAGASKTELAAMRREIQPLARRLAARLAMKQRAGRRGQLDFRRTIRTSLSTGGVPMATVHRPRRPVKTDLVILCDVSESVMSFARFTLLLVYALREQFSRVRTFAFVDEIDEVSRFFTPGSDVLDAVTRLTDEADVTWLLGRTDYGRALERFEEKYPDAVGHRTSLLILGDARSNYGDISLPVLERLVDRAHAAHWLNPERRTLWSTGDSAAHRFAAVVPMVECRNLAQLAGFVRDLPV
jgi:uncharacterized protein with von Willebrand factor type A (vWA) domain